MVEYHKAQRAISSMQTLDDIIIRFGIDPSHSLKQQNAEHHDQEQTQCTTCWYVEKDEQERVVARYRSWSNQGKQPPYRSQIGWERYSPTGTLMEREVRYAKQGESITLH